MSQRFLFEKSFDKPRSVFVAEPELMSFDDAEPEVYVPEAPIFSEEDMRLCKEAAYNEGVAAGYDKAVAADAARQNQLLAALLPHCETLLAAQETYPQQLFQTALCLASTMVKQLFPSLAEQQVAAECKELLAAAFDKAEEAVKLTVHCCHEDRLLLETLIASMPAAAAFNGKIVFQSQPDFQAGDLRLDWGEGGVERLSSRMLYKLDTIITRHKAAQQGQESEHE